MAPANKANYKSYEAQARMVRAIVAAHPDVKWNYKEIAECYGSDMTKDALNHRFRRYNAQSLIIDEGRKKGFDMKHLIVDSSELPGTKGAVDVKNIAKYFGQSTGDGMQFQFRGIKKDAEKLRATHRAGGDVAKCLSMPGGASVSSTPVRSSNSAISSAGRSGGSSVKRPRVKPEPILKRSSSDEEADTNDALDDGDEEKWSDLDETPIKRQKNNSASQDRPGQKNGTPSRRAATKAAATIVDAAAQLNSSESDDNVDTPASFHTARASAITPVPTPAALQRSVPKKETAPAQPSIFGEVEPYKGSDEDVFGGMHADAFNASGVDSFLGSGVDMSQYGTGYGNTFDNFEI